MQCKLVINLKTAQVLGLIITLILLFQATEVMRYACQDGVSITGGLLNALCSSGRLAKT
jgi:hypothetical protein